MRATARPASLALLLTLAACGKPPPRTLSQAIVGTWDVWCRTDTEATSTCLGRERDGLMKRFDPGGKLTIGVRGQTTTTEGTWRLEGARLVLEMSAGAIDVTERYRARIEDDRLILWGESDDFGTVHGRAGATFVAAKSKTSTPPETHHTIGGAAYKIGLPAGYRLARDDHGRQEWEPTSGSGLRVRLTATDDRQAPIHCFVEHTRGHLEATEEAAGRALCASLVLE